MADEKIRDLVEPAVITTGCELWDVALSGPRGRRRLLVSIDAPGGVDIERCSRVARTLRPVLDAAPDYADVELEVSSPGAERRLRGMDDYRRFIGERVNVRFRSDAEADGAETVVEGLLGAVDDDSLTVLARDDRAVAVPLRSLVAARLAVDFGGDDRPHRRPR
ncbi:MAG: ribosome maturation factor RimP [Chloroflexota bacterium]|jgi:ribosome maturation factor RimP|nr:ribosome maturation factor RimP [Chloroflexota bacterium]